MTKGSYNARIELNADAEFVLIFTYEGRCVPGRPIRTYATRAAAERTARKWLEAA